MRFDQFDSTQLQSWELLLLRATHEMSLTAPQYKTIEDRYATLQEILAASNHPLLQGAHVFVQGSIELRTTIKPVPGAKGAMGTIDADAVVWLPNATNASASEVLRVIEERFREGTRVDAPIVQLRRGIRIEYADEKPGFHIDITPARCAPGNADCNGVGALQVPDRELGWKASSPREYSAWLQGVSKMRISVQGLDLLKGRGIVLDEASQDPLPAYGDYIDGNPLRASIKLLKRHRDVWALRYRREDERPISAIITTLATRSYEEMAASGATASMRPIEIILRLVDGMRRFVDVSTISGYEVLNPKDPGENFAEKWNRPGSEGLGYRSAFDEWHLQAVGDLQLGLMDLGGDGALRDRFTERFGVTETMVREVIRDLPGNWTLPGRTPGYTRASASLAALAGPHASSSAPQSAVVSTGRLG